MSLGLNEQLIVFLLMIVYGGIVSIIFDLLRSIYRIFKPSALTVGIADVIFWLFLSILTFFAFFLANNGQLRFFEFLAMILGSIVYFLTLSKPILLLFSGIFFCFKKIFCIFFKFFLTIICFLYKMLLRMLMCIVVPILALWRRIRMMFKIIFYKLRSGIGSVMKVRKRKNKEGCSCKRKRMKKRKKS